MRLLQHTWRQQNAIRRQTRQVDSSPLIPPKHRVLPTHTTWKRHRITVSSFRRCHQSAAQSRRVLHKHGQAQHGSKESEGAPSPHPFCSHVFDLESSVVLHIKLSRHVWGKHAACSQEVAETLEKDGRKEDSLEFYKQASLAQAFRSGRWQKVPRLWSVEHSSARNIQSYSIMLANVLVCKCQFCQ